MRYNEQKTPEAAGFLADRIGARLGAVLDIGCGSGQLLLASAQRNAERLVGVDTDQALLERARANVPTAEFALADVQSQLPFENASFDTVFFCDVIEHLHNPVAALHEIHRVLRPHGRVLITTPNANSIVRRIMGKGWFALADPTHVLFYTRFTLAHVLSATGYSVRRMEKLPLTGSPVKDAILRLARDGGTLLCLAESA